jgi:hypothetical protein
MTVKRPAEDGWKATLEWSRGKKDAEEIIGYARKKMGELDFLMDRFSYSELVYCRAFDRPCDFPWYQKLLRENKDVLKLVYVYEDYYTISKRWSDEKKPTEHIVTIISEYLSMISLLGLEEGIDFVRFCPTHDNIENLVDWIKKNGKDSVRPSDQLILN